MLEIYILQENTYVQTWWLTGKEGYNFTLKLDVCVFVPKKVKLDRVVVKRDKRGSDANIVKKSKSDEQGKENNATNEKSLETKSLLANGSAIDSNGDEISTAAK